MSDDDDVPPCLWVVSVRGGAVAASNCLSCALFVGFFFFFCVFCSIDLGLF